MSGANITPIYDARVNSRKVFCTETAALTKGYLLCYDHDYGTATDNDPRRDNRVALPTNANNNAVAGVLLRSYSANAMGQWVEIAEPGSTCQIYVDGSVTIGDNTFVTAQIGGGGSGTFNATYKGFMGRGTAKVMQTRTGAGLILAKLMDGDESGLIETIQAVSATAVPMMKGGVSLVTGAITIATDSTDTLADGSYVGMKKRIFLIGALTTQDYLVTVTSGEQLDGSTDLASLEFDGAGDDSYLVWTGTKWRLMGNAGTGLA